MNFKATPNLYRGFGLELIWFLQLLKQVCWNAIKMAAARLETTIPTSKKVYHTCSQRNWEPEKGCSLQIRMLC